MVAWTRRGADSPLVASCVDTANRLRVVSLPARRCTVTPVIAVILGILVLHEELNWRLLAGGACTISSIAMIVVRKRRTKEPASEELELVPRPS